MTDEHERCFCKAHGRVTCHECRLDFSVSNEYAEVAAGLRKKPSRLEELAVDYANLQAGLNFIRQQGDDPAMRENLQFHIDKLKEVDHEMKQLKATQTQTQTHTDFRTCSYCHKGSAEKMKLCARCNRVAYCSRECQKAAWRAHKQTCIPVDGYQQPPKLKKK